MVRRATAEDAPFMADMLVEATNWSADWKKQSRPRVPSAPTTTHYLVADSSDAHSDTMAKNLAPGYPGS